MERRQYPRFACFEEINFIISDMTHTGIMLNFSRGGFFIMTALSQSLDVGQSLSLAYYSRAYQSRVHFYCTVVRKETTSIGVAIQPGDN